MENDKYIPNDKDVKAYIKQVELVPGLFFCKDENYFSSPLYLSSAPTVAKDSSHKFAEKELAEIMKGPNKEQKKSEDFNYAKFYEEQLAKVQEESKKYGEFVESIDKKVAEVKGEEYDSKKIIAPNQIYIDAVVELISKTPELFMKVNTEYFTSKDFLDRAQYVAKTTFEKEMDKQRKQTLADKKTTPELRAERLQENSKKLATFNDDVTQKLEDESYNIRHENLAR